MGLTASTTVKKDIGIILYVWKTFHEVGGYIWLVVPNIGLANFGRLVVRRLSYELVIGIDFCSSSISSFL